MMAKKRDKYSATGRISNGDVAAMIVLLQAKEEQAERADRPEMVSQFRKQRRRYETILRRRVARGELVR